MKKNFSLSMLVIFISALTFSTKINAQKSIFVRVYDLSGKKISKGRTFTVSDTSLQLVGKSEPIDISVRSIGSIKTKHSAGNNVLIGSIAAFPLAIIGAATAEPNAKILGYTAGEGAAGGALVGLPVGAAIGGVTILFKNSKRFIIDGDLNKCNSFKNYILEPNKQNK